MEHLRDALHKSLQTGFIDQSIISNNEYLPQLLVNDKSKGKKILTTIDWQLKNCDEFWFSVAFVTTSGVATLINTLVELEEKGIKGKILVSQYLNFSQPEALKKLLRFKNIELKIVVDGNFHSKGYLFKNDKLNDLIIGSSNLTANALCLNKEWNLKITATAESYIIYTALNEFASEFDNALPVNEDFITKYEVVYYKQLEASKLIQANLEESIGIKIKPNGMQIEALANIKQLRAQGKTKALLISATGTGKTYLSAFDALNFNPSKFLFVVHRANIAEAAMKTFKAVFGSSKSMGFYSGNRKEVNESFLFSTIQTISRDEHLNAFKPDHFDYIVIDETHRAGADSYQKILNHFKPKFLLGMTATPERTDGLDIFKLFDHTIAYEIRLQRAMDEEMLSPFHYYGVTDISIDGLVLDDKSDFKKLIAKERIERILEKIKLYGSDNGKVRGLIFCSRIEECVELSNEFNKRGYKTLALTGINSDKERSDAINRLESNLKEDKLDYLFTVDIFNEGVDIPCVNQVIMLRPTQSAIIFVQQLGRGLRKTQNKEYLTVIDFIGNYSNNYMVPIALYSDTSYNKDNLRKLMSSGSSLLPGASTINFDKITKERIFKAIDSANLQLKKDLVRDYQLLKYRLGHVPLMIDFVKHGCRDPFQYVTYSRSYFNFITSLEDNYDQLLSLEHKKLLELFSSEISNAKRIEEVIILIELLKQNQLSVQKLNEILKNEYSIVLSTATLESCIRNLNFDFIGKSKRIIYKLNNKLILHDDFIKLLENKNFSAFLNDTLIYAKSSFDFKLINGKYIDGFILYQKYSRKDVFRILNWETNPIPQNVGGYLISGDKTKFPIFVTYHKKENISETIKYEDGFINNSEFKWETKNPRTLKSPEIELLKYHQNKLRVLLFIQKSNDEGIEFYYMGDFKPIENSFEPITKNGNGGKVVKVRFSMDHPVENFIYNYLTENNDSDLDKTAIKVLSTDNKPFRIIPLNEVKQYINCVPLYDISAAAGNFSELQQSSNIEWVELSKQFKHSKDYFVCKVQGESMNKVIPNDSWCLFKKDPGGSRDGKIVLVQHTNIQDSDFGSGYTVKLYQSKKEVTQDNWHHESIILKPQSNNPEFKAIVLIEDDLRELKVEGVFVSVLT